MNLMMPTLPLASPEFVLLIMGCLILLVDVFVAARFRVLTYFLVQATVALAFILTIFQYQQYFGPLTGFRGHYLLDQLAILLKLFIYPLSFLSFAYARTYLEERKIASSEYYILGLFCVMGMSVMASAYSLLTIYLGLELLSLPLYALVASYKDSEAATEAAMKYFVMGALASGLLLYGISILYGLTGSIDIPTFTQQLQTAPTATVALALVFIIAALIFKFGAVPFHMWVPDVYQGAPTAVTLFIATAPKVAAFGIIMRILVQAMPALHLAWQPILIVIALLSMLFGNLLAIVQQNLKRMLAYSSIAHIGYSLLGIIAGPSYHEGYSAALFYLLTYTLMAAGAFGLITLLSRGGIEADQLEDYRGLNIRSPWLAFMLLLLLFSMAGIPPTVGFFAKLGLLNALVEANLVWLAIAALVFAIIGAYYYLRVVMLMYFEEPTEANANQPIKLSFDMQLILTANGLAVLLLGILPSALIDFCRFVI